MCVCVCVCERERDVCVCGVVLMCVVALVSHGCCCLCLYSVRYHTLHPNYIHERLERLGSSFELRLLLVHVDAVSSCKKVELSRRVEFVNNLYPGHFDLQIFSAGINQLKWIKCFHTS